MALIDSSYTHRDGETRGIGYRRWVIAQATLRACMEVKGMRWIIWTCWISAVLQGVFLFAFGQLMDPNSLVYQFITQDLGIFEGIAPFFQDWANKNPRIAVGMTYNLFFFIFSGNIVSSMTLTLIALGMAIPRLITSDLASRAITIYSSKAVSRFDYILGKFGGVLLLMAITWLGPVMFTWAIGNCLAPKLSFFVHTWPAFWHSVVFIVPSIIILGLLAMGISASTQSTRTATAAWLGLLLLGAVLSSIGSDSENYWLQYLSFWFDLELWQRWVFDVQGDFAELKGKFPIIADLPALEMIEQRLKTTASNVPTAIVCLSGLVAAAVVTLYRRVKPE